MINFLKKIISKLDGSTHEVSEGYLKKLYGGASIILGAYFLAEHLIRFGDFEVFDFWGHEYLGLFLIIIGLIPFFNFKKK